MTPIDIVIPAHPKDFPVLRHGLRALLRHVSPIRRIVVIAPQPFEARDPRVRWVADPPVDVLPSPKAIAARWAPDSAAAGRAGWLYQQLVKLGAASYVEDLTETFVVVDADVVFLRPVAFDLSAGKRNRYSLSAEHVPPYADAYERLVGRRPPTDRSLTAHHMVIDRGLMAELTAELERRTGVPWYDAFLGAVDPSQPAACEQSTYGWWVLDRHPELAEHRQLQWHDVRAAPSLFERARLAPDFDFVAAHAWKHESFVQRASSGTLRVAAEVWHLRHARPAR